MKTKYNRILRFNKCPGVIVKKACEAFRDLENEGIEIGVFSKMITEGLERVNVNSNSLKGKITREKNRRAGIELIKLGLFNYQRIRVITKLAKVYQVPAYLLIQYWCLWQINENQKGEIK